MINYKARIEASPTIMLGKPVIKGTRISVELILKKLADAYTPQEISEMYPTISVDDIMACMAYAAAVIQEEAIIEPKAA